jgi:hypothetical protein
MPDYSLVPVDYQPDFDDYSLVPVDYDQIARGFQEGAQGGVGLRDSGAVARGHMHWDDQKESDGDRANARAYTQQTPDYNAWVGSWYGYRKYWHNGKPTGSPMPDWNRYKY